MFTSRFLASEKRMMQNSVVVNAVTKFYVKGSNREAILSISLLLVHLLVCINGKKI